MDFGSALRRFREERTLSLRELGVLSGVDHAYIHRLESGDKSAPSDEVLDKLARGLKLAVHKRRLLELLATSRTIDPLLFDVAIDSPARFETIRVATTMSFRGARPETKDEWLQKLSQIEELIGNAGG
jgi:transcriptional regulator with XRE-family HTH domain